MKKLISTIILLMFSAITCFAAERNQILVYKDLGVEEMPLKQVLTMLSQLTKKSYTIKTINAEDLINTDWETKTALFVIPGGADIPYTKKLNGKGNQKIIHYVQNGGSYLGLCAGGYYGASSIEFAKGTELEVIGKRELSFYPGIAIGPALAKYVYNSNEGARTAFIKWHEDNIPITATYFNGGAYFENPTAYRNVTVLAKYENLQNKPAAIVKIKIGKGTAILTGVHFEYAYQLLDANDPFLKQIIPQLQKTDHQRFLLANRLLIELGIKNST